MFVELLGLPASGKSTLFKFCKVALKKRGLCIASGADVDNIDQNLPGYFRRNAITRVVFRTEQFRTNNPKSVALIEKFSEGNHSAKALLYASAVRQLIYQKNPETSDVLMMGEGCLHRAIYLIATNAGAGEAELDAFCDVIPLPDAVIYLELPATQSYERALARLKRRANQSDETIERRIKSAHGSAAMLDYRRQLMERALDQVSKRGCQVIRVDAQATVDQIGTQACDQLLNKNKNNQRALNE